MQGRFGVLGLLSGDPSHYGDEANGRSEIEIAGRNRSQDRLWRDTRWDRRRPCSLSDAPFMQCLSRLLPRRRATAAWVRLNMGAQGACQHKNPTLRLHDRDGANETPPSRAAAERGSCLLTRVEVKCDWLCASVEN
jgi:hypothetical protein